MSGRFRGGHGTGTHRFWSPGGGLICTSRGRVRFAHLLPQETSAWRNLITVFRTVNNRAHFFSKPDNRLRTTLAKRARDTRIAHRAQRNANERDDGLKPSSSAAYTSIELALSTLLRRLVPSPPALCPRATRRMRQHLLMRSRRRVFRAAQADLRELARPLRALDAASGAVDRAKSACRWRAPHARRTCRRSQNGRARRGTSHCVRNACTRLGDGGDVPRDAWRCPGGRRQ